MNSTRTKVSWIPVELPGVVVREPNEDGALQWLSTSASTSSGGAACSTWACSSS